ncbi:MAG TPA: pyrimidine dimer DNA glycosylase/endonuclease V, partial [Methanosarcina sp.]|nr:pyrimidine dimer DNA glycosylase/endonuclease V [Methanosarcina sp.]
MNIFFVSMNPVKAAELLCDQHVIKMTLESLQILYTSIRKHVTYALIANYRIYDNLAELGRRTTAGDFPPGDLQECKESYYRYKNFCKKRIIYKATHIEHPCVVWASSNFFNFMWLLTHFSALCDEYEERYGKEHGCKKHLINIRDIIKASLEYVSSPHAQVAPGYSFLINRLREAPEELNTKYLKEIVDLISSTEYVWEVPLVIGETFKAAMFPREYRYQSVMFSRVGRDIESAYQSYYHYKLETLTKATFKNLASKSFWTRIKGQHDAIKPSVYVVNTDGILINRVKCIGLPQSKIAVIKDVSPKTRVVTEFYQSVGEFYRRSPVAKIWMPVEEKEDTFTPATELGYNELRDTFVLG